MFSVVVVVVVFRFVSCLRSTREISECCGRRSCWRLCDTSSRRRQRRSTGSIRSSRSLQDQEVRDIRTYPGGRRGSNGSTRRRNTARRREEERKSKRKEKEKEIEARSQEESIWKWGSRNSSSSEEEDTRKGQKPHPPFSFLLISA